MRVNPRQARISAAADSSLRQPAPSRAPQVPFFVIAVLPLMAVVLAGIAILGITIFAPKGYESQSSRVQKAPGALATSGLPGWIERVQGAQYNTYEACIHMLCTFYIAQSLNLPSLLFAKLASFFLVCRAVYPIVYALDIDMLRTQAWMTGLYAVSMVAFAALFPDTIMPILGA